MAQLPPGFVMDGPKQGGVFTLPTNPRDARKDAQTAENDRVRNEAEIERLRLAKLKDDRDAAEFAATHNPDGTPKAAPPTAEQTQALKMKSANIEAMTAQLQEVERQLNAGFVGQGDRGFMEYLPTGQNRAFDAASAGLTDQALGAFRTPGMGSQSDAELRSFTEANRPGSWEQDATNAQRVANIRTRLNAQRVALGLPPIPDGLATGAQKENRRDAPPMMQGGNAPLPPDPWNQNSTDPLKPSSGLFLAPEKRQVPDNEALALANSIIAAGGTFTDVNREAERRGMAYRVDESYNSILPQLRAQAKGKQGFNYVQPPMRTVDNTVLERISGGGPAATVAGFTNTMTGGAVKALGGQAYDDMAGAHPNFNAAGEIAGAIGATSALGKAGGALAGRFAPSMLGGGRAASLGRGVATDAAYGGIYGGMTENDPVTGAVYGAGGSLAGRAAGSLLGKAIQGIKPTAAAQYLSAQGVPLTFGQTVGGFAKSAEDRMSGLPVIGDMVNARRMEGFRGYNQAEFNNAGQGIGYAPTDIGENGLRQLHGAKSSAYSGALDGAQIDTLNDPQLVQDVAAARASASGIPNVQPTMPSDFAMQSLQNRVTGAIDPNGMLDGRAFQEGYRGLARDARTRVNSDFGHEIGQVTRQGQDALAGALERQNPGAFAGFKAANDANRRIGVLASAVDKARNGSRTGELNVFAPSQYIDAASANARKFPGGLDTRLAQAAQEVMPNKVPDSGTAGRLAQIALPSLLGGAVTGGGYAVGGADGAQTAGGGTLGLAALLALGGTKGGQKALKAALTDSGSLTRAGAARLVRKTGGLFGKASAPLLLEQQY